MAELTGSARREDGTIMRTAMGEVFVFRDGLICERRAFVVPSTKMSSARALAVVGLRTCER